jgi:hypothetical protein
MKTAKWFAISSVLVLASLAPAQDSAAMRKRLTNQDIISMVQMGLSEDVITAKIRATNAAEPASISFDTSVDSLKALKVANVPDAVIRVMINPGPPQPAVITTAAPMTLDPNLPPPEIGVYWKDGGRFVLMEGQALSQAKIGGRAGAMFTYGIRGLHWDAYVNGPTSRHIVKERRPVFYIYVPDGTSSSDYSLMKLNKKGDRREFQIGSLSGMMGGGKAGVKRDKELSFQAEHVGIRTYKVILDQDLKPGEYAFFMATGQQVGATGGEGTGGAATGRIYDFSLPE